jgi:hypothetical protein
MRRFLLLACASVALLACGGDSTGPAASAEGTWNLQTVNGSALPYTAIFVAPSYRLEILSDQIVAHADGTYDETFTTRETNGTTVTTSDGTDTGSWSQHGNTIDIIASDGSSSSGTMNGSGNRITVNSQGAILVYARQ